MSFALCLAVCTDHHQTLNKSDTIATIDTIDDVQRDALFKLRSKDKARVLGGDADENKYEPDEDEAGEADHVSIMDRDSLLLAYRDFFEIHSISVDHSITTSDMTFVDVFERLCLEPLPFALTFSRKDAKCAAWLSALKDTCCCCCCCKKAKKNKTSQGRCGQMLSFLRHPSRVLTQWLLKLAKLSAGAIAKGLAVSDAVTDGILLYEAAQSDSMDFMMIFMCTLFAPYVLCYRYCTVKCNGVMTLMLLIAPQNRSAPGSRFF